MKPLCSVLGVLSSVLWASSLSAQPPLKAVVEIEETVYTYEDSQNGSFPLWTYGSTVLTRRGDTVLLSATETVPDAKPLNCVRWALMTRKADGWRVLQREEHSLTREPSPIVLSGSELLMSVNPTLVPDKFAGPAQPGLLAFRLGDLTAAPRSLELPWSTEPLFSEHSYRGIGCDPENGNVLLMNVEAYRGQHWVYRDGTGDWLNSGLVEFPSIDSYKGPIPIRFLYPGVALRNGAAHVITKGGVEDFVEERVEYRKSKNSKVWGRYHLGYSWSPDIARQPLSPWIYAVDLSESAGEVWNCDLWIAPNADCYILWWEKNIDTRLRPKYFSDVKLKTSLRLGVMRAGKMVSRVTLLEHVEGTKAHVPQWGRFHATQDGRLFVFTTERAPDGRLVNRLIEIGDEGTPATPIDIPLEHPFTMLSMTAAAYGGTLPSHTLEVVGRGDRLPGTTIRYARIQLVPANPPADQ